jgi:hypothetical protein
MKKINSTLLLLFAAIVSFAQTYKASLSINVDKQLNPGSIETMTIRVTNTSASTMVVGKSDFTVSIVYDGSTSAGQVFNHSVKLSHSLPAGESYTFSNISFKAPILPGTYPVKISFLWGRKVISQIETIDFIVAPNYNATISAKNLSFSGSPEADLQFSVTNSGETAWPEGGTYSLKFELRNAPSAAPRQDRDRFNITPKVLERWDLEPGESEDFTIRDFRVPLVTGNYVVRIYLLLNGRSFEADGATRDFTFKVGK